MKTIYKALAAGLLAVPALAQAELSANVGVFSQYYFRGIEQTKGAALQGGVDYIHPGESYNLYAGAWASNLDDDFGLGEIEINGYGGARTTWQGVDFDAGARYYYFPDESGSDTIEPYIGVGAGPLSFRVYYTPDYYGSNREAYYVSGGVDIPLMDRLVLTLHAGLAGGPAFESAGDTYDEYAFGLTYQLPWWELIASGAVLVTDAGGNDDTVVFGLSRGFQF